MSTSVCEHKQRVSLCVAVLGVCMHARARERALLPPIHTSARVRYWLVFCCC
jgi:hypothetical protein